MSSHFDVISEVLDLSQDVYQIKTLTGDHGEHFNRIVTEVELLGVGCDLCGKMEAELQQLKNHSQHALGRMQASIHRIQMRLESGTEGCSQVCSHLEDEVHLLREDIKGCVSQCRDNSGTQKDNSKQLGDCQCNIATVNVVSSSTNNIVAIAYFIVQLSKC